MRALASRTLLAPPQTLKTTPTLVQHTLLGTLFALSLGITQTIDQSYAQTEKTTVYRETFTFCSNSLGKEAAEQTSWLALKSGSLIGRIGFLKVFPYGSRDIGNMMNSAPLGYAQGYSFWSKAVYGLSVLTDEFPIQASLLSNPATTIEYVQRLSGINATFVPNKTHLLFLIDSTWYISDQGVAQTNGGIAWEKVSVTPATLTYGTVPLLEGRGADIPQTGGTTLPTTGTVRAFGLFLREVNGRVRIDNFSITTDSTEASAFSITPQDARTDLCPGQSPDKGQTSPPVEPPLPDDKEEDSSNPGSPNGIDQQIPNETPPPNLTPETTPPVAETPPPTPTASPAPPAPPASYTFCPTTEEGSGKALKPSVAVQRVLKKNMRRTSIDLRNRFMAALLFQKKLPLGSLVNLPRSNYDSIRSTLIVPVNAAKKMQQIKLTRGTAKILNDYLSGLPAETDAQAPLLAAFDPATKSISPKKAVCLAEINSLIRRYAKSARINTRLMFVGSKR
jgi:hypothetical protein